MFTHGFPYTNFHDLNLDWIIKTVKILFNKAVFSINNVEPDDDGNVTITGAELGAVGTVNNIAPVDGNVTLTASDVGAVALGVGVTKVNGFSPDSAGNVLSGTVRSINGISPASLPTPGNVVLNASDVGALPSTIDPVETVNGISPDANGNVNVGTVKSVNGSTPDVNGNINLPTVAGVTSVNSVGPDANGNVALSILENTNFYVDPVNGSDDNPGTQAEPFKTISHVITLIKEKYSVSSTFSFQIRLAGGIYPEYVNISRVNNHITFYLNGDCTLYGFRTYMTNCNFEGAYTLNFIHGGTYSSGNHYISITNAKVLFTNVSQINITTDTTGFNGIHLNVYGEIYIANNINFIEDGATFTNDIYAIAGSTAKINNIVSPTTKIGMFSKLSLGYIHAVNNATDITGTLISDGSIVTVTGT